MLTSGARPIPMYPVFGISRLYVRVHREHTSGWHANGRFILKLIGRGLAGRGASPKDEWRSDHSAIRCQVTKMGGAVCAGGVRGRRGTRVDYESYAWRGLSGGEVSRWDKFIYQTNPTGRPVRSRPQRRKGVMSTNRTGQTNPTRRNHKGAFEMFLSRGGTTER